MENSGSRLRWRHEQRAAHRVCDPRESETGLAQLAVEGLLVLKMRSAGVMDLGQLVQQRPLLG